MQRSLVGSEMCIRDRIMYTAFCSTPLWSYATIILIKPRRLLRCNALSDNILRWFVFSSPKHAESKGHVFAYHNHNFLFSYARLLTINRQITLWKTKTVVQLCRVSNIRDYLCRVRTGAARPPNKLSQHPTSYLLSLSCLLYTSPSPRDYAASRMPSSA